MKPAKVSLLRTAAACLVYAFVMFGTTSTVYADYHSANPCAANPCAANPCAANPCAANPCAVNPCAANPCAPKTQ